MFKHDWSMSSAEKRRFGQFIGYRLRYLAVSRCNACMMPFQVKVLHFSCPTSNLLSRPARHSSYLSQNSIATILLLLLITTIYQNKNPFFHSSQKGGSFWNPFPPSLVAILYYYQSSCSNSETPKFKHLTGISEIDITCRHRQGQRHHASQYLVSTRLDRRTNSSPSLRPLPSIQTRHKGHHCLAHESWHK